ncbi:hypothetical protein BJY00DRAFT_208196 [Aspergillus carlsbadensis]|nr:hypothetical protein BJY00DRAFT_208196 [Aspergillus carlsbadensis]
MSAAGAARPAPFTSTNGSLPMSRHSADRAPPAFLFVDYQDDNPQNRSIEKEKRVFAQKTHQRKKRLAAVERLKTSTHVFRQRLPFAYTPVDDADESSEVNHQSSDARSEQVSAAEALVPRNVQAIQRARMREHMSPKSQVGQGFVDPFSTTAVPMNDFMNSFFQHLRNFTIHRSYPLDTPRMTIWWWQKALSQPAIQLALLVSAASHQTAMNTIHNAPSQHLQRSIGELLRLRGDTITTLNGLLAGPDAVGESTILIVAALRAIESISANVEGATAHTRGLNVLIQLYGGLDRLDHMTLSKIYHGEIMYAAITDTVPSLPLIPTWRSEILQEANVLHSTSDLVAHLHDKPDIAARLSILGASFFQAHWYAGLEESMKTFLCASQRLIQYYEVATLRWSIVMPTDNDLFVLLEHQLASTRYPPLHPRALDEPSAGSYLLHEPLRLALLIYLNARIWHFQAFPVIGAITTSLQRSLLATGITAATVIEHIKVSAPDVLFWIVFLGAMAAQGHEGDGWFVEQTRELARYLGLRDWEAARDVLAGFFYTDQPGEPGGEELWKRIESHGKCEGHAGVSQMSVEGPSRMKAVGTRFLYKY